MKNKILASMWKEASEFMEGLKKKMGEWWEKFKFNHPWKACSLQYFSLFLLVLLVGHILSGMANVDYFRYLLNEIFRHPFNLNVNLTINRTPNMKGPEMYAAEMYADNARSILCTLVASEAAIVAIVVSLTLIAIELTASEYSPRVIKVSLRNPDMWLLLLIYGVAIFLSIILIKELPYESRFPTEDVSLAFWFGVFSYVALVPYMWNIPQLLDPTNIVKRISADIAKDKLLKYINKDLKETSKEDETNTSDDLHLSTVDSTKETSMTNGDTEGHEENPIQPILDIVYRSINNYDLETVRNGLEQIVKLAETVIDAYNQDNAPGKDNEKLLKKQMRFSKHFCDPLKRISGLAASKDDEGSTREVIKTLQTFGEHTANAKLNAATEQVAVTLGAVGEISARKGKAFEDAVSEVAKSLEEVGKAAVNKRLKKATEKTALSLGEVGEVAVENDLKIASQEAAKSLGTVGGAAVENDLKIASQEAAKSLGVVGKVAAKKRKEFGEVISEAVRCLGDVERKAIKKDLLFNWNNLLNGDFKKFAEFLNNNLNISLAENAPSQRVDDNKIIIQGEKEIRLERKEEEKMVTLKMSYGNTHKYSLEEENGNLNVYKRVVELEETVKEVVKSLGAVGEEAAKRKLKEAVEGVVSSLSIVGDDAVKNKLGNVTCCVAVCLGKVGEEAAKEGLEEEVKEVARSLRTVGEEAAKEGLKEAVEDVALSLGEVGEVAVENDLKIASQEAAKSLGTVGGAAVEKDLKIASQEAAKSLGVVGKVAAKKGKEFGEVISEAVTCLGDVERKAIKKDLLFNWNNLLNGDFKKFAEFLNNNLNISLAENAPSQRVDDNKIIIQGEKEIRLERKEEEKMVTLKMSYGNTHKYSLEEENGNLNVYKRVVELEETVKEVVKSLGAVGEEAAKEGLEEEVKEVARSLRTVGEEAAKEGLEEEVKEVALSLRTVGTIAEGKKGLEDAAEEAASALATLGCQYFVENVIDEYNSNKFKGEQLGESNFRNFIERYKQKLREMGKDAE